MERPERMRMLERPLRVAGGDTVQDLQLRPEDIRLIIHCRRQKWGELTVRLKDGCPVMITRALQNIKLDQE